ncbi:helix-turn-helix domain-containing protein [Paenibacillus alginolyticus]|uniref:Helix-turn-helix domain-containing protein n=1 Tax=Paenibacillus alginolyticus TaxID=59839 RepID=A0ABT4GMU9_9BACL|nr:helix-turn-helix domain-containing protein [Paenibacillus alginolyticus]MCY9697401.1 helix-turn-helix domain-containing protein [Paenibacillus alginolyticus]MEC0146250.1 helix-turn-helix domain-containing protein [Paenibacillus alginolyticus]
MFKLLSSKYLIRLHLLTLLIGTIPVVVLGSLSYIRAKDSVQEKVNDSNMQLLQQTQLNVEQVLQLFENLMTQYISTSTVNEALQTPFSPNNFVLMNELSGGLNKMQPYELGIHDVYVVNQKHEWVLSNQGYSTLDESSMKDIFLEYAKSTEKSFWSTYTTVGTDTNTSINEALEPVTAGVRLVKKLPINRTINSGLIIGELSRNKLEKLVFNESKERETVILDAEFRPLTQPSGSVLKSTTELKQAVEKISPIADSHQGYFTFKVNQKTIGVNFTKSDYNDWYYLSFSSLNDITKDSRSIGWYTFYISMGTFTLILLMAWIGSKQMYMPIRRVFSVAAGDDVADKRQGKDELQFIGEQIHHLRTSQTHMKDQLRIHSKQLEAFFIRRLLQGEGRPSETRERWIQFAYDPMPDLFAVSAVEIDTLENTRYSEQDMDLLLFAINNITSELIPLNRRLEPIVMVDNQLTICREEGQAEQEFEMQLYAYAEQVQKTVAEILGLKISIGISRPYRDINLTHQAYKESLEALKYRVRFGDQAILPFNNVLPDTQITVAYPDWLEKELIDAVKMEERDKARELLREFIQKAITDNPRYYDLQMVLTRLLIDLLREWQEAGETTNSLHDAGKPLQEHLLELRTGEEIEAWFYREVIEPMMVSLRHKWDSGNQKISERMLKMIHEEFDSALTLELCASRLNYHPNYIKTVFRKETGTNFSDYLSNFRLSIAKQWLVETDLKISEIAEKLHYQNSQNFIRYFRKMEDMTPGQYRDKHR